MLMFFASLVLSASPGGAVIQNDSFVSTWGVRGLKPSGLAFNYHIRSMVTIGDRVYVTGRFAVVVAPDGSTRNQSYIAAFDRATGAWVSSFTPTFDGPIHALAASPDGSSLYAGGEFRTVNGAAQRGLVALNPATGARRTGFNVSFGQTVEGKANVMALEVTGNKLLVGGEWSKINNANQPRLARINQTNGALDTGFDPKVLGGQVLALEVSPVDGKVYLGGQFDSIDGDPKLQFFAALDSSGTPVPQPRFENPSIQLSSENVNAYAILEVGDTVFVGTHSNLLFVLDRTTLARKWHYGPELNAWDIERSYRSSDFQSLSEFDGAVYAGTHVRWNGTPGLENGNGIADSRTNVGAPANTLVRFTKAGNHDQSFVPMELKGSVWATTDAGDGCLWIGGNFDVPGRADWNLARMCQADTLPYSPFGSASKFVEQQHLDFYARKPSAAETNLWLASGADDRTKAAAIVAGVVDGPDTEIDRQVVRLYTGLFSRLPDQGGLDYWIDLRRKGLSLEDMVDAFLVSPEFQNLVGKVDNRDFAAEVYRRILHREPDVGGLNYWESVLNGGFPRRELVVHFTESVEFVQKSKADVAVIISYSNMVQRIPTTSELAAWSKQVAAAGKSDPVTGYLFNSSEYRVRISLLPTGKP